MKRLNIYIIVLLLLLSNLTLLYNQKTSHTNASKQLDSVQKTVIQRLRIPELKMGMYTNYNPYSCLNSSGNFEGILVDYMKAIENHSGLKFTYLPINTVHDALQKIKEKQIDIVILSPGKKHAEILSFSNPFHEIPIILITKNDFPRVNSLNDFTGKKIIVDKGHVANLRIKKDHKNIQLIQTTDCYEGLRMMYEGKADAYAGAMGFLTWHINKYRISNLKIAWTTPYKYNLSFGVRKDFTPLLPVLNKIMAKLPENTFDKIYNRWISIHYQKNRDWDYILKIISLVTLIALVASLILILWNRSLKKEIFERKKAEIALKKNQYYLEKAQTIGKIGTWELDIVKDILIWTDEIYRIFGIELGTPENYELFLSCVHPDDRIYVNGKWGEALNKKPFDIEHRLIVDGKIKWVRQKAYLKFDENGKALYGTGVTQEITDTKKKEAEIQFLSSITEKLSDSIVVTDLNFKITYINKAAENLFGYRIEELIGKSPDIFNADKNSEEIQDNIYEKLSNNEVIIGNSINVKKNGTFFNCEYKIMPLKDKDDIVYAYVALQRDITIKKKFEAQLKESEILYRSTLNDLLTGVVVHGGDSSIQFCNPQAEKILGLNEKQMLGKEVIDPAWNFVHPDLNVLKVEDYPVSKVISSKKPLVNYILGITKPDKDYVTWVNVIATPIFSVGNELKKVIVNFVDITEHKNMQDALLANEKKYKRLFESSASAIFVADPETGMIVDCNSEACNLVEMNKDEIVGMPQYKIHPSEKTDQYIKSFKDTINNPDIKSKTSEVLTKSGNVKLVELSPTIIEVSGKKLVQGIFKDITDRVLAERNLMIEKDRAEKYLQLAGVMFIGLDKNGIVTLANDKACEVLEAKRSDIIEKKWFENFLPEGSIEPVKEFFNQLMQGQIENIDHYENSVISSLGNEKIIDWHNSLILDNTGNIDGLLCAGEDKTLKNRLEMELHQSQKMNAIGTLAGGIAHDFNNMLTIILGYASFGLSIIEKDDQLFESLSKINDGALKAQSLTYQLLTFSKGGEPVKKVININPLIESSAEFSISGSKSTCNYELESDLWLAEVDEGQLNQVIGNLVINATQAMPEGGIITLKTTNIEITTESKLALNPGKYVEIKVEDNGNGISEKHLSRIFEPYFSTKQTGSGLGLATTYSIIKKHDGSITVESVIGNGTSFTIHLPATMKPSININSSSQKVHKGSGKILVMDDEEMILDMLKLMLESLGYETSCATGGELAIEMFRESFQAGNPFDLVILDITVPGGKGGVATIPGLLKIDSNAKVIVSSGYSTDPVMAKFKDYGFTDVIPKPYTKKELINLLNGLF